jgi:hypothetical protein
MKQVLHTSFYLGLLHNFEENMSKASDCIADVMLRKTAAK